MGHWPQILLMMLKRFRVSEGHRVKDEQEVLFDQEMILDNVKYRLVSMVVHQGTMEGGHYWAICPHDKSYVEYNDDKVTIKETVMDHSSPYLLIYEKI